MLVGQSPLYLHGGKTLCTEKVKLSRAHRGALAGLSSPTLGQNSGAVRLVPVFRMAPVTSVPRSSLGKAAGGEEGRDGPCRVGQSLSCGQVS